MTLDELLHEIRKHVTDRVFALAPDALGAGPVADLIRASFPLREGKWTLTDVPDPRIEGAAVVVCGRSTALLGVDPADLEVAFDLTDGGRPALLVDLALDPAIWNPGLSFPSWAKEKSPLTRLVFDHPAFRWSSVPRPRTGSRPALGAGLNLTAAEVLRQGVLAPLVAVEPLRLCELHGVVAGRQHRPIVRLDTAPSTAIRFGHLDLPLTLTAVAGAETTRLELASSVHIGVSEVPVGLRFDTLGETLTLSADPRRVEDHALSAFAAFVDDAPIGDHLDKVLVLPKVVGLRSLDVTASIKPVELTSVALGIGTKRPLTIVPEYVELAEALVDFTVVGEQRISAVLAGTFRFVGDVDVTVTGKYPELVFTGTAVARPPVSLATVAARFLPREPWLPDIALDRVSVRATLPDRHYSFDMSVSSVWDIPVGVATVRLTEAMLALGHDGVAGTGFRGAITATARLIAKPGREVVAFAAEWKLPATAAAFALTGKLPEISLTGLGAALAGTGIPRSAGLPEIMLRDSAVVVRATDAAARELRVTGATTYELALETDVHAPMIGSARLFLLARLLTAPPAVGRRVAAPAGFVAGFVAGMVLEPDWTPDSIWQGLDVVFEHLQVKDAGLILASTGWTEPTLPNLTMAYVPTSVGPGVTFFGSLLLAGDVLGILGEILPATVELDLSAHVDPDDLTRSEIQASLPVRSGRGAVRFTTLTVGMRPGAARFELAAAAELDVHGVVELVGHGTLNVLSPGISLSLAAERWREPFGLVGLTVDGFGLSVSGDAAGITVGLLGTIRIGAPSRELTLTLGGQLTDLAEPSVLVFAFDGGQEPLTLGDVIRQFTALDPHQVPLLADLGFTRLEFYLVADPSGWTAPGGHHYPRGIGLDANLLFLAWELRLEIVVAQRKGVLAKGGVVGPIELGDVFVLSDATGRAGPNIKIDTTNPTTSYFTASGRIRLLGLAETFRGHATTTGFEFVFTSSFARLFTAEVVSSLSAADGYVGRFSGHFDFHLRFPRGVKVHGQYLVPPGTTVDGPRSELVVECAVGARRAHLHVDLDLHWHGLRLDPSMTLDATGDALANLWHAVTTWISRNPEEFFAPLLDDVDKWVSLLRSGVLWAKQSALDVALALVEIFEVSVAKAAELFDTLDRFDVVDAARALGEVFHISLDEAIRLLRNGLPCALADAARSL